MIAMWQGVLVISYESVLEFIGLPVASCQDRDSGVIMEFMPNKCWRTF
jgi:hypothetical protein